MDKIRNTFKKSEHLCRARDIEELFENGRWLKSEHFRFLYFENEPENNIPVKVLFSVPKKLHRNAVTRNLLRRRMREAYRCNKNVLLSAILASQKSLNIAFVYNIAETTDFQIIEMEIKKLLAQLISRISKDH